jgi:putative methyltransferase (TIGR04325 family)
MPYRNFIKSLVPPIFTDFIRGGRLLPTWEAAVASSVGYDDQILNSFKVKRASQRKADGSLLTTSALFLMATAFDRPGIAVTDFGGSTGDLGLDFLSAFPHATYVVVENPTIVKMMPDDASVRFVTHMPATCDIFFTSGTLQYLGDPLGLLEEGFSSAKFAVILARNSFCDVDLFRVQRTRLFENGSGAVPVGFKNAKVSYPHRTLNEAKVREVGERHGFRCIARIEDRSGVLPYRNMVYGQQLVFTRARSS